MQGVFILKQLLERDALKKGEKERHEYLAMWLNEIYEDFRDWLGETKYRHGLNTIPPSRFSHIDANGLWEFSPYLCGVGLLEGLELAYLSGMLTWDRIPEIVLAMHLHNMLVKKGHLKRGVGLFDSLEMLFPSQFFAGGKAPTINFSQALLAHVGDAKSGNARSRRAVPPTRGGLGTTNIHGILDPRHNFIFKSTALPTICRLQTLTQIASRMKTSPWPP